MLPVMRKTRKNCLHFLLTPWESDLSAGRLENHALESQRENDEIPELLFCVGSKGTGMHKSPPPLHSNGAEMKYPRSKLQFGALENFFSWRHRVSTIFIYAFPWTQQCFTLAFGCTSNNKNQLVHSFLLFFFFYRRNAKYG